MAVETRSVPRAASGRLLAAAAAMSGCAPVQVPAAPADLLPFPAQVSTVIERGAVEGHAVRVLQFNTQHEIARVLALTRRAWSLPHGSRTVEASSGPWSIVSRQTGTGYQTLQAKRAPDGHTEGLMTYWDREHGLPRSGIDLAALLPADAHVRRRFVAVDARRRSETLVAVDDAAPRMVAERIGARIAASGLRVAPMARAGAVEDGDAVARLYLGRGSELALTVHRHDGGSAVVMHLSEGQP